MDSRYVLPEKSVWDAGIYQLEVTDAIRGYNPDDGTDGPTNLPTLGLANRTAYLKNLFLREHGTNGSHSLTNDDFVSTSQIPESKIDVAFSTADLLRLINDLAAAETYYIDNLPSHTLEGDPSIAWSLSTVIPISWDKSKDCYAFELFTPSLTMSLGTSIKVTRAVIGDNSIDLEDNSSINVGEYYILSDETGHNYQFVCVKGVHNPSQGKYLTGPGTANPNDTAHSRILITDDSLLALSGNGYLRPTNVPYGGMAATVSNSTSTKNDFIYVSAPISTFSGPYGGKLIVQHTPENTSSSIIVEYKETSGTQWIAMTREGRNAYNGMQHDIFTLPANLTTFCVRVRYLQMSEETVTFTCISLISERAFDYIEYIRKPSILSTTLVTNTSYTINCDAYGSLYGENYNGLDYQVSTEYLFPAVTQYSSVSATTAPMNSSTRKVSFTVSDVDTSTYVRMRYKDDIGNVSRWSTPFKIGE